MAFQRVGSASPQGIVLNLAELAKIFPEYAQFRELNRSGQKEVVEAVRQADQQRVAIKLFYRSADDQARIAREIEAVSRLQCQYVPRVFGSGEVNFEGEDRVFLIEEFISGTTYRAVLQQTPVQPLSAVLDLANTLLHACSDCETQNLVHRDLKPENLIVDPAERFGF